MYTYWRSSAAYRVRIALNIKGVEYDSRSVHLVRDGGEQHSPAYRQINPQGLVPALVHEDRIYSQSLAIIEYLEERYPEPSLLPRDPGDRARVRGLAQMVACDIHPLNNSRVQKYLVGELGLGDEQKLAWYRHWITLGFGAIEARLDQDGYTGRFCHGDTAGLADLCLVPQVYNAERFGCDVSVFPTITRINAACLELDAFLRATPESQPDAD
ncbi:MAG: maleylacetoacetate isomerase [Chromatiales bacterium]|nr:maleylacetoacetate isomerase [Chromatiales bacterium]